MEELKLQIHGILKDDLYQYIPAQEITHAANEIIKTIESDGTYDENKVLDMQGYLSEFDKEYYSNQTVNTKSITNNQVRLAMHKIRKAIDAYKESIVTP